MPAFASGTMIARAARLICAVAVLMVVPEMTVEAADTLPQADRVRILHKVQPVPDINLIDHHGEPFSLKALQGNVALILFGFTNCPDVCPLGMERMLRLARSGRVSDEKVKYVLISVDGERDTPEVMKAFVNKYSPSFIGLTAEPARVKKTAKPFKAAFFKGHHDGNHDYSVSHSPQIFVVDPQGRIRAEFYDTPVDSMARIVMALLDEQDRT